MVFPSNLKKNNQGIPWFAFVAVKKNKDLNKRI